MFATQKLHDLNLSTAILHSMSYTYSIIQSNMLQSGDISYFLFQGGFSSWNLPHFEPNAYHFSEEVHFAGEYVFFSGSGLPLLNIISDYDHCPKDTGT